MHMRVMGRFWGHCVDKLYIRCETHEVLSTVKQFFTKDYLDY